MKLLKSARGHFNFHITVEEKEVLFQLLAAYPVTPAGHRRLKHSGERAEDRQMLEEALVAQREQNRRHAGQLLKAEARFKAAGGGFNFNLRASELEWMLQVLNDVRVGSWIGMGAPEGQEKLLAVLNEKTARFLWMMEAAGFFEMALLRAADGGTGEL